MQPPDKDGLLAVIALVGETVRVVQPPSDWEKATGGNDVDCVVSELDAMWPLRLPPPWRLCGIRHYGSRSWQWVVENQGDVVILDTTDDPKGLRRCSIPTDLLLDGPGPLADPAARAAYLTEKRLLKGSDQARDWRHIGDLAGHDAIKYRSILSTAFGDTGRAIADRALQGSPPTASMWRQMTRAKLSRRLRSPIDTVTAATRETARILERMSRPSGLFVLIAGPDGTGKSTLASELREACEGLFRREKHFHWKPGLIPRPGALLGREALDPTQPHSHASHPKQLSVGVLVYHWLDFWLGGWIRIWPQRMRAGLVVMERGWWDFAVDPRRYRLQVSPRLVQFLGKWLPRPDLTLVLEASPEVLLARKAEISATELARQMKAWRKMPPPGRRHVYLDAAQSLDDMIGKAREEVVRGMEERALSSLGFGWSQLPRRSSPRWSLPRGPAATSRAALLIYQPVTLRGRAGWELARAAAAVGGFRLFPRGSAPPPEVRSALARHLLPGSAVAVARANRAGRYVALVMDDHGSPYAVAKVATDERDRRALEKEAEGLEHIAKLLGEPLSAPRILDRHQGILLLEAVPWSPRARPWTLPEEVAWALGEFFRAGAPGDDRRGAAHGDFAPWNLLRSGRRWVLLDWEEASRDEPAFFDILHYLVQSHSLLGRPSLRSLMEGIAGKGSVGRVILAYADAAGLDPRDAGGFLTPYLRQTEARFNPNARDGRAALAARGRLREQLSG